MPPEHQHSPQSASKLPYKCDYEAALERGARFRAAVLSDATTLDSQECAERLSVSRGTVNRWRRAGKIFALQDLNHHYRYPAWQLEPNVLNAMPSVLESLGKDVDQWGVYLFFTNTNPLVAGERPLDALKNGGLSKVVKAAVKERIFID